MKEPYTPPILVIFDYDTSAAATGPSDNSYADAGDFE